MNPPVHGGIGPVVSLGTGIQMVAMAHRPQRAQNTFASTVSQATSGYCAESCANAEKMKSMMVAGSSILFASCPFEQFSFIPATCLVARTIRAQRLRCLADLSGS
ncbi:MAG: hypothetical protein ACLS73_17615 [Bilophila wadsworthia]|uniref:hypothetical protein n=1 Tax=Bilophila wadsworthia TaxID=35833 RepID=UPI002674204E|nr:hypothetical protein [Bilophila wadsworthia]